MKPLPEDLDRREAVNASFREEADRFGLRYRCRACIHVVHATHACSLGFPNTLLRGNVEAVTADGRLTFCKAFELA